MAQSQVISEDEMKRYGRAAGIVACCVAMLAGLYFACLYLLSRA